MSEGKYRYASAPYNFIPLPEKVVYRHSIPCEKSKNTDDIEKILVELENKYGIDTLPTHDKFEKNLKTGYIEYTLTVETPLFISNGNGDFFNIKGNYTIPGSTIRGKLRSNAEILSWSNPEFVKDDRLWYRGAFSRDVLKKLYNDFLLPNENSKINDNVKAGYLINENGQYKIRPAKEDRYKKSFRNIHEKDLAKQRGLLNSNLIRFMYNLEYKDDNASNTVDCWNKFDKLKDAKKILKEKFKNIIGNKKDEDLDEKQKHIKNELENKIDNIRTEIKLLLKNNENKGYNPYYCGVSYNIDGENKVKIKYVNKFNKNNYFGVLMNSDKMKNNDKQNHYLIFKPDFDKSKLIVSKELKDTFQTSVKLRQKISKSFHLPKDKEEIPVFYIINYVDNSVAAFGFTPYLKIPYKKSVCDGIHTKKEYENIFLDYVQSIFGFTDFKYKYGNKNKSISYKGRVSFTNARLVKNEDVEFENEINKSLMSPKISSFQLYLNQDKTKNCNLKEYRNNLKTYDGDFQLRGYKFYWLKDKCDNNDDYEKARSENNGKRKISKEQFASLKTVKSGAKFKGRVYFENLDKDELGLLMMAIKPFQGALDNLGQGKPYGFGKVEFNIDGICEINIKELFKKFNVNEGNYLKLTDEEIEKYKSKFKDFIEKQDINFDSIENNRLKCFCMSKYKKQKKGDREFSYIDFNSEMKVFTNRNVLKSMEDYTNKDYTNIGSMISFNSSENKNYIDIEKALGSKFKINKRGNH